MILSLARHRRSVITAVGVFVCLLAGVMPTAQAISTYNSRPATERTNVGEMFGLYDQDHDGVLDRFSPACSGTMISDNVYLTAAHCLALWRAGTRFYVSLDQDVRSELDQAAALGLTGQAEADWFVANGHAVEGDRYWDPDYTRANPVDLGVIDFSTRSTNPADVWTFTPATLPAADELSMLGSRALDADSWTTVGYGTQQADHSDGGKPTFPGGEVRLEAPMGFNSMPLPWVRLSAIESRDFGSACYGDSGGPNFVTVNGQDILASITVTGDAECKATNVTYRMDIASTRSFLSGFVALP